MKRQHVGKWTNPLTTAHTGLAASGSCDVLAGMVEVCAKRWLPP